MILVSYNLSPFVSVKQLIFTIGIVLLLSSSCKKEPETSLLFTYGQGVTDVSGNSYITVIINGQEWMAQNLRTTKYCDGTLINALTTEEEILEATEGGWVHYDFDSSYENPHGKLYNGYAANDDRNPCPCGWRVPTTNDWDKLITFLGGENVAGEKMKFVSSEYNWSVSESTLTNVSGFSCYPSGLYASQSGISTFGAMGNNAVFWSSTGPDTYSTWRYTIRKSAMTITKHQFYNNNINASSIRCIKN